MNNISTSTWLWTGSIVLFLIVIIYAVQWAKGAILQSIPADSNPLKANHLYYLPASTLQIKATAKVVVKKDTGTGFIIKATLAGISLETIVQIVPDTQHGYALVHHPSIFSNDEMTLTVGASGLLEGINLTIDDRISNIITQVTDAPKSLTNAKNESNTAKAEEVTSFTTETIEYTNTFLITTAEIKKREAKRSWIIPVDGVSAEMITVDASFHLKFTDLSAVTTDSADQQQQEEKRAKIVDGIISRPLGCMMMELIIGADTAATAGYELNLPDTSRLITIAIKRSPFVKKVHNIKLINGMLTENTINKPSEAEAFISIPIKIAKAIMSVPAALLQFKIDRTSKEAGFETAKKSLLKAQLETRKEEIGFDKEIFNANHEVLKAKLESEKSLLTLQKEIFVEKKELQDAIKDLKEQLKKKD